MNKPNILIVGPSGSGKSSCYRNLPPSETVIIDVEQKGFPFRSKFTNVIMPTGAKETLDKLKEVKQDSKIKYIVFDSLTKHFENLLGVCRASYKGYDIWSNYAIGVRVILNELKSASQYMIAISIDEFVAIQSPDGANTTARRATVQGKEWEGKIEKEFLIAMFTDVRKPADKNALGMSYNLMTNTDGICSAKTPVDMFKQQYIPNDLNEAIKVIEGYYK